ncbi:hypothetical protein Anapl_01834 [Anas platyrhynchos]|uniref:Uncharacterized protein n=1 Tax=Anas platyrhynchos TaxID=8839 RepID=R0KF06_ANAPL|nr:hypothetical protein Anapl_01834 [Anas platyrhynchos]
MKLSKSTQLRKEITQQYEKEMGMEKQEMVDEV